MIDSLGYKLPQVYDLILGWNNNRDWPNGGTVIANAEEGTLIHKIDAPTAMAISTRAKASVDAMAIPPGIIPAGAELLTYILACIAEESAFDPNCQNANIGVDSHGNPRSNPTNNPLLYDMGPCQLKLAYLIFKKPLYIDGVLQKNPDGSAVMVDGLPGVVDHDTALAFALDINRAIPYFCEKMLGNIQFAQQLIAQAAGNSAIDPRMNNPLVLATDTYNFGEDGVQTYYFGGEYPTHGAGIVTTERNMAATLNIVSCFANLPS